MNININKLKAIILYFSINTKYLGKVKLAKLIYFLDFIHLKSYGRPITYDNYVNLEHGPIPSTIKNLIDDAGENIDSSVLGDIISIKKNKRPTGNTMIKFISKRDFGGQDKKYFSESEFEILEAVADRFKASTSDQIEEASHKESPWKETKYLDVIPYTLAARDVDSKVSEKEIELMLKSL